jgi:hypothetical protein
MEGVGTTRSVGGLGRWSLECPAGLRVWLLSERATDRVLVTVWLATGSASPLIRSARRGTPTTMRRSSCS